MSNPLKPEFQVLLKEVLEIQTLAAEVWVYHNRKRTKTFDIYNHVWERDKDKEGSYL